jgi:hypothetical protein
MLVCNTFVLFGTDDGAGSMLLLALRRGEVTGVLSTLMRLTRSTGGMLDIRVDVGVFIVGMQICGNSID